MNADRPRRVELSDAERRQLRQIERDLLHKDAKLVRELRRAAALLPIEPVQPVDLLAIRAAACCLTGLLALMLLAAGSVVGGLAMCVLGLLARCLSAPRTSPNVRGGRRRGRRARGRRTSRWSS